MTQNVGTSAASPVSEQGDPRRARGAVRAAFIGFLVDNYDIYLPVVALAPAMGYFTPASIGLGAQTTFAALIFAVTLIGRPIGATLFGHFADRIGRRRTAIISAIGFGTATLLIALLPGYTTWGWGAIGLLLALRLLDGIMLGGQYTAATPLALENSPRAHRGLVGGFIQSGGAFAFIVIGAITLVCLGSFPSVGDTSPYVVWGWRIPFVLGALFSFGYAIYIGTSVDESYVWKAVEKKQAQKGAGTGIGALLRDPQSRSRLARVFLYMTGLWFILNSYTAIMPGLLTTVTHLDSTSRTVAIMISQLCNGITFIVGGIVSQRVGRRRYLTIMIPVGLVAGAIAYGTMVSLGSSAPVASVALIVVGSFLAVSPWALSNLFLPELFKTENRGAGFGIAYSFAAIIPALYTFYQGWLSAIMPVEYTVVVFLVLGGLLALIGVRLLPETRDVDFAKASGVADQVPDVVKDAGIDTASINALIEGEKAQERK